MKYLSKLLHDVILTLIAALLILIPIMCLGETNKPVVYKGHDLPRLRGAMVSPTVITNEDLLVLGKEWNANLVRWQLIWAPWNDKNYDAKDMKKYDAWLEMEMNRLDKFLPVCKKYGLKVLIDLHTTPGGKDSKDSNLMFLERKYQEKFAETWEIIARRYKNAEIVWGYDLANEPEDKKVSFGLMNWHELATHTSKRIRDIDPIRAIIYEPLGGPIKNLASKSALPVSGIVYSIHVYPPLEFTHQGEIKSKPIGVNYPGIINGEMWDKNKLRQILKPAIDFHKKYGVHIYVGEFGAVRWAPNQSSYRYMRDLIELFEENNWDWSYHAFREWHAWNVELSDTIANTTIQKTTVNKELIKLWFGKNLK